MEVVRDLGVRGTTMSMVRDSRKAEDLKGSETLKEEPESPT